MSHTARHRQDPPKKRRILRAVSISVAVVLVAVMTGGFLVYRHLEGNITGLDITEQLGSNRPSAFAPAGKEHKPMNILLLGSDTREGQGNHIGGETPGLSDTTILLHLSADRTHGVRREPAARRDGRSGPTCLRKDGNGTDPGGLSMFNAAFAVGGPACTVKTVEQLTGIRIDHFVVIDFNGFKHMVDALDGVTVCVPEDVHDPIGHIDLRAGTYKVNGPAGPRLRPGPARDLRQRRHRPDEAPAGVPRRDGEQGDLGRHPGQPGPAASSSSTPPPSR